MTVDWEALHAEASSLEKPLLQPGQLLRITVPGEHPAPNVETCVEETADFDEEDLSNLDIDDKEFESTALGIGLNELADDGFVIQPWDNDPDAATR